MIRHYSVMYRNVLQQIKSSRISRVIKIADCNFGFGGHSHQILKTFPNTVMQFFEISKDSQGFDIDPKVIEYYRQNFHNELTDEEKKRLTITNDNFTSLMTKNLFDEYDFVLADFGFNNFHIKTPRGFSWLQNEDLDMRYNQKYEPCKDIIQRSSLMELRQIFEKYTDLRESKIIAESILAKKPIKTTFELRDAVVGCFQKDKQKKVAQVFQAFRIATNNELQDIQNLCNVVEKRLARNGQALFITFHSIQRDRVIGKIKERGNVFDKISVESPSQIQLEQNSMSRSAKMLSFRKKN